SSGASLRSTRPTVQERSRPADTASSRTPTRPMRNTWRPPSDDSPPEPDRRGRIERWDAEPTSVPIGRAERGVPTDAERERERARGARHDRGRTPGASGAAERPDRDPARGDRSDRRAPLLPRDPARKGGISFDDDLADYMHPDDVPPKTSPPDPDDHDA